MSTLEVKPPNITGTPGRTICVKAMIAKASAVCSTNAPASDTGAIAPASVNGVTTFTWPNSAKAHQSIEQFFIDAPRRIDIERGQHRRLALHLIQASPARDRHHADRILGAEARHRARHHRPVGIAQDRIDIVEMARRHRQIERLDHRPAREMDDAQR